MGCGMLPVAAPAAALYSGCAFNDAAAMAATVTRLEAELAHAKAALADRHASQEGLRRQKRALEADVARLHAEVPFCHVGTAVHTFNHRVMRSIVHAFVHTSLHPFICSRIHTSHNADHLHDGVWHSYCCHSRKHCVNHYLEEELCQEEQCLGVHR